MTIRNKLCLSLIAVMSTTLMGCANTNETSAEFVTQKNMQSDVYGLLSLNSDGYRFSKFKINSEPHEGTWVNLRTGTPIWRTNSSVCVAGLMVENRSDYCGKVISDERFMVGTTDAGNAFASVLVAPLTLGISLTTVKKNVYFDKTAFAKAMGEALAKISVKTLDRVDVALQDWKVKYKSLVNLNEASVKKWKDSVHFSINDQSHLFRNDFEPSEFVYVTSPKFDAPIEIKSSSIENLYVSIQTAKETNLKNTQNKANFANVLCSYDNNAAYNLKYHCPSKLNVDLAKNIVSGDLVIDIISAKKERVIPSKLFLSNDDVIVKLLNGRIGLENKTDEFIAIESISFYYNDKIAIRKNLSIELAPKSELLPSDYLSIASDFNVDWRSLEYTGLTSKTAKDTKVNYGFAIKYSQSGNEKSQTLYKQKKYRLIDLI